MNYAVINGEWIRRHLPGQRGDVARLGRALGISTQDASKVLADVRNIQPGEVFPLLDFLGFDVIKRADPVQSEVMQLLDQLEPAERAMLLAAARGLHDAHQAEVEQSLAAHKPAPST